MRWLWCTAVVLLSMCLPQAATAVAPLSSAGPVLEEMGKRLEDQTQPAPERLDIIKVFGEWATSQVRPPLVAVLKDPQPEIREAAARALGWQGNNEAVPALQERIEASAEVPAVKAAAVRSLGRIGDLSARALVVRLTSDPDTSVRQAAVWSVALGALVDQANRTPYLIQLAEDGAADTQERSEAIRALADTREERVVASLSKILEHEPRRTIALPEGQPTEQQKMMLRYAQIRDVPAWTAAALGQLQAKTALPIVLGATEDPNDFFLRLMAVKSLAIWNIPQAYPAFVKRLDDPVSEIRVLAVIGLHRLGDPKAVEPVLAHLSDKSPLVRAQMVTMLATVGGPTVRPQLEALEQRESEPEVLAALEAALSRLAR